MNLLKAKKYWNKLRSWCFYHWKWLVLISAFIFMFFLGRKSSRKILKQAQNAMEAHKLENRAIERAHNVEIKRREKARKKYEAAMTKVEEAHKRKLKDFDEAKKKELQKNLKLAKNNPTEIDKILFKEFGLREVK